MDTKELYQSQLEDLENDFLKYKKEMEEAYNRFKDEAPNEFWLKFKISESSNAAKFISYRSSNNPEFMRLFELDQKLAYNIKVKSAKYVYELLKYPSVLVS